MKKTLLYAVLSLAAGALLLFSYPHLSHGAPFSVPVGGTATTSFSAGLVYTPGGSSYLRGVATSSLHILTSDLIENGNLFYTSARDIQFSTSSAVFWLGTKSTNNLAEGSNLYYTDARAASYISSSSTVAHAGNASVGNLLNWSGAAWLPIATSTLKIGASDLTLGSVSPHSILTSSASAIVASSTPAADAFVASSASATSTFAGGLSVAGATGLNVLQNARVLVGTTTSQYKFEAQAAITSASANPVGMFTNTSSGNFALGMNNSGTGNVNFGFYANGAISSAFGWNKTTQALQFVNVTYSGNAAGLRLNNDGSFAFYDGATGSEKIRMTAAGNLGIGTASPTAPLHVATGDVYVSTIGSGVILKSPDGTCARGTISNVDVLTFASITCP